MSDEDNGKDLHRWMGKIDANVASLVESVAGLVQDFRGAEKETRAHRETVETRFGVGRVKFNSFGKRIEKLEIKNGIKNTSNSITWKWIVEKVSQPIFIIIMNFVLIYVLTQVVK